MLAPVPSAAACAIGRCSSAAAAAVIAAAATPTFIPHPHTGPSHAQQHRRQQISSSSGSGSMAAPITGKTVVVVGGSRGIGAEFVRQFVGKGNRVLAACRWGVQH